MDHVVKSILCFKSFIQFCRGRNQRGRASRNATGWVNEAQRQPSEAVRDVAHPNDASRGCKAESGSETVVLSLQDRIKELEQHVVKKVVFLSMVLIKQ